MTDRARRPSSAPSTVARLLGWVGWTLGGLALLLLTAWSGAYFWLGSSPGRASLIRMASEALPPGVEIAALRWGPWPDEVALGDLVVRAPGGRELMRLVSGSADVSLGALFAGEVEVERAELDVSHLEATADEEGRIDLAQVLAPPRAPSVAGAEAAKGPRTAPQIDDLKIRVGELWADLGEAQVHVRDLRVEGALDASGAARIALTTGPCHASWNKSRRSVGFDDCRLAMSVQGKRLEVASLELRQADKEVLVMHGEILLADKPKGTLLGRGELGPYEANVMTQGALPLGLAFDGLVLSFEGDKLSGSLGEVMADRWVAGPFSADYVSFGVEHFSAEPGLLVPELEVHALGLAAARLEGLDWRLEGLWIPFAAGDLERKLAVDATGWSGAWILPAGDAGPIDIAITALLKLTGGQIAAQVDSREGLVEALGNLKSSPLTKRTSFSAEVAFAGAGGPLAAALSHDLDDAQRAALGAPLSGTAALDVDVARADRYSPWETTLEWVGGRLDGKTSLAWDGYAWGTPAPDDAPDQEPP